MIKDVKKIWGKEEWLVNNELYCAKKLYVNFGYKCSDHFHESKDETFYILKGIIYLFTHDDIRDDGSYGYTKIDVLKEGDSFRIFPKTIHSFISMTDESIMLEVSTMHEDKDSHRIQNSKELSEEQKRHYLEYRDTLLYELKRKPVLKECPRCKYITNDLTEENCPYDNIKLSDVYGS